MTDRYSGFTVILEEPMRADDAEFVMEAIKMLRHVARVEPVINTEQTWHGKVQATCDHVDDVIELTRKWLMNE